ncbi:SurA N-terminal domain-containing protein [Litorimonas sp. RW-G-Af-16]|uniref:peptidylprolyl isomerase n=1 Tax=Litorimonas sp. RW-G-Af-16 TaxID=3241168 RepID=UPI00390C8CE3
MANTIGGKIRNVFVGTLIALLVLAFAVWGVNDVFTPGARDAVLSVGDTDVSEQEFDEAFTRRLRQIAQERGEGLTNEEAYQQGLHRQVLQALQTQAIISEDADDLGIGVNRRDARKMVESIPAFQNELTGQFSEEKLDDVLNTNRITRAQFEKDTLADMRREQTVPAIIGGIEAPAGFATRYFDFISEQRRATVLTLNEKAVDPIPEPDEATLKSYIAANSASYMAPEYRQVIMLRLEPFDFTADLDVTDQELREAFDYQVELGQIGSPERRSVTLITANDEETAMTAAARMAGGEDPAQIAASLGLSQPDEFTNVGKNGLVEPQSGQAAFELGEGDAKAVLGSLGTWIAVYVPSITPAVVPDFDKAEADVRKTLMAEKAKDKLYDITGQIEDEMTLGKTLEEIAADLNLTLSEYSYIDRSGTTIDGIKMSGFERIPGIAQDDTILREIFISDMGFETDLFETESGGYASIRVNDIIDTKMRPFEEVKDRATAFWKAEQLAAALTEKAIEVQGEIRGGKTFEAVKAELGEGATLTETGVTRTNPPRKLGGLVTVGLLDGKEGDIVRGEGTSPREQQIARLDEVRPNRDALAGQFLDVLQERASAELSSDIQEAYSRAVLAENPLQEYPAKVRSSLGLDAIDE